MGVALTGHHRKVEDSLRLFLESPEILPEGIKPLKRSFMDPVCTSNYEPGNCPMGLVDPFFGHFPAPLVSWNN